MSAHEGAQAVPVSSPVTALSCSDCGLPYGDPAWVEAIVPHDIWNEHLSPAGNEGGILCINCMAKRAIAAGLSSVPVVLAAGPFRAVSVLPLPRFPFKHAKHNDLSLFAEPLRSEIVRVCTESCQMERPGWEPCVAKGHACYRCQDIAAQGIEARSGETAQPVRSEGRKPGPRSGCAQDQPEDTPHDR